MTRDKIQHTGLSPIIKWAGGKEKELFLVFSNLPQEFDNYYEPFVGGGSVYTAFSAKKYFINDISTELIELYRCIATSDESFYSWMHSIIDIWDSMLAFVEKQTPLCDMYVAFRNNVLSENEAKSTISSFLKKNDKDLNNILSDKFPWHRDVYGKELRKNMTNKILRMKKIEMERHIMPMSDVYDNIETAFMSALYMYFRCLYNDYQLMRSDKALNTALFVFIRNYSYSGMFRYNANGDFNVPYGGIGYNHKSLEKKIEYYQSEALINHFKSTKIYNMDFEDFFVNNPPSRDDFIFLDPPYDTTFSTYAKNEFTQNDQRRLANYLINVCEGKWMMVIKNTPFIRALYNNEKLTITSFDKKYLVSFMNRNDKCAEHLIITNY